MVRRNTTMQARYRARHARTGAGCHLCGEPIDDLDDNPDIVLASD